MKGFSLLLFSVLCLGVSVVHAQISPDCGNAIPICNNTPVNGGTNGFGADDFNNAISTGCLERTPSGFIESNSAWYRFRTAASGELGFNIGFDSNEDWDFALYRASNCANLGDPLRCNFFDNSDNSSFIGVGEDPTGDIENIQYEDWLQVEPGEDYYLLINNFSSSNSGFSVQFSGNIFVTNPYDALDCSIINNLLGPPIAACANDFIELDATSSDAVTYNWFRDVGSGFQQIPGEHNPTVQADISALYRVEVITLSGVNIISDVQVSFAPIPNTYPVLDVTVCSETSTYDLSQKDLEALGGQNPNNHLVDYFGSLIDAINGTNALPNEYPITSGTQTVYFRVSSIDNPNCFDAPEEFELAVLETPTPDFPLEVFLCDNSSSTITIGETTPNPNYSYTWDTGEMTSYLDVSVPGDYILTVTNTENGESCSTTRTVSVVISLAPEISEIQIADLQESNAVTIVMQNEGHWEYQLDNNPYQNESVFNDVTPGEHQITINDLNGCGTVTENIIVMGYPKFFSPNGDNINDSWHIEGIIDLQEPVVYVYDRYGKLLKQMDKNSVGWDGTFNGVAMPSTDYWFKLSYINSDGERTYAKYLQNHFSLRR